jgi:hypothetical protein
VQPEFVQGDVTELPATVGSYFRLLLHFGCFHDELTDEQRRAEVGEATRLAASPATLLMMAWARGRRGPLPRGATRADIAAAFSAWEIDVEGAHQHRGGARLRAPTRASIACAAAEPASTLR